MRRCAKGLILLIYLLLWGLAGCGREENDLAKTQEESDEKQIYYRIQETAVPDPDETLWDVLPENGKILELDLMLSGDTVYRVVQIRGTVDGIDNLPLECYIQVLEQPYKQWTDYLVPNTPDYWNGLDIGSNILIFAGIGEDVYGILADRYLVRWNEEGVSEFCCELPETVRGFKLARRQNGGFYGYGEQGRDGYVVLDEQMQIQQEGKLEGRPYGIVENSEDGTLFWYGEKEEGFGVWHLDNGKMVPSVSEAAGTDTMEKSPFEGLNLTDTSDIRLVIAEDGEYYLTDKNKLWRFREDRAAEVVCDFTDRGYILKDIDGMTFLEDGSLLLMAEFEGSSHILRMTRSEAPPGEKQEVMLAMNYVENSSLKDLVVQFNRQSEDYHITILMPEGEGRDASEAFVNMLRMEISAGRGPDLICDDVINIRDLAENGYLQSLAGTLTDENAYLPAAMDYGKIDGVCYGIPYECKIHYLATCSRTLAGERSSWTLPEMMEAVEKSNTKILARGLQGSDIVCLFGLYDNDNRELIDWEKGESHLTEEPFLKLLAFAKKYRDIWQPADEEIQDAFESGEIAFDISVFDVLDTMKYLEACFQGEAALLGLPRSEGNGIYMVPNMLCLNANSEKKEGVQIFLRFLLSEESQDYYIRYSRGNEKSLSDVMQSYHPVYMAVRLDALEKSIQREMNRKAEETIHAGIHYSKGGWSEQQAEDFRCMLENSRPANWYVSEIQDMVYEELAPYFEGQCSAEAAAEILDNRVQLYLDERN